MLRTGAGPETELQTSTAHKPQRTQLYDFYGRSHNFKYGDRQCFTQKTPTLCYSIYTLSHTLVFISR